MPLSARRLTTTLLVLICAAAAAADYVPEYHPEMTVSRAAGEIVIDGRLGDDGWRGAGRADDFAEHSPGDQVEPPVDTAAWMTYDDDALYVAWYCWDDPASIRATLTERDDIWRDDYVILALDTFGDQVWAYEIAANPFGVQGDLLWSSNGGEDLGYDLIYETAASIVDDGWIVEMRIPWSSLRFPTESGSAWRVDFWRNHPRSVRGQYSWAAYDRDEPCWPCQWGFVHGVEDVRPGRGLELLPSVVGFQAGGRVRDDDGVIQEGWENGDSEVEASLGAKYAVSSGFTLEGTWNPDFSQVEADAAQIDVNTTFALFYPERRPFFQEGSDLFRTYFSTVYTRSINDPSFAAKVTGRPGRTNVAYLVARDEHTPMILPFEESSRFVRAGKSVSNILRVRHALGDLSHVGVIQTDRRLDDGGSGSVTGADARIRITDNAQLEVQVLATHTDEPDDAGLTEGLGLEGRTFDSDRLTALLDGEAYWGHAVYSSLEYGDRRWDFDVDYWERSPTFRADNGFEPGNNSRQVNLSTGHTTYFEDSEWFDYFAPRVSLGRKWNFQGVRKDQWLWANATLRLKKAQTSLRMTHMRSDERFRDIQFDGIELWEAQMSMIPAQWLDFGVNVSKGHRIARGELVMGDERRLYAWYTIKPFDRITISGSFNTARSEDLETGAEFFDGYIARTRLRFQVNRELSARLVLQYNDFRGSWEADPLVTYRLTPFSIFYVGSTRDYEELSVAENGIEGWRLTDRQYFMKLQYLFQI